MDQSHPFACRWWFDRLFLCLPKILQPRHDDGKIHGQLPHDEPTHGPRRGHAAEIKTSLFKTPPNLPFFAAEDLPQGEDPGMGLSIAFPGPAFPGLSLSPQQFEFLPARQSFDLPFPPKRQRVSQPPFLMDQHHRSEGAGVSRTPTRVMGLQPFDHILRNPRIERTVPATDHIDGPFGAAPGLHTRPLVWGLYSHTTPSAIPNQQDPIPENNPLSPIPL